MLELKDICFKRDGKVILDHISFVLDTNLFVAITGPNGSGKSTLAKIIMGIEKPDSGTIFFDGKDITNLSIHERAKLGISFAFQQPVKFKGITVYDLLKLSAGKDVSKKDVCFILKKVGLCADAYIDRELNSSLSGGELKRIEIATVLLRKGKLTIFDEPEAGIDLWSFNHLIDVFKNYQKRENTITLIITHQERILNIADQILLLKDGKIAYFGPKNQIMDQLYQDCNCPFMEGGCDYECRG